MKHQTPPQRTDAEKRQLGDACLFLAALGPLIISRQSRLEGIDLALYLLDDAPRRLPLWWDNLRDDQQLTVLQLVGMTGDTDLLVMPSWRYMRPQAQDAFSFRIRQKLRHALQVLGRTVQREARGVAA